MTSTIIVLYIVGALFAFMVSFIPMLEDDHMKTGARTVFWPLYAAGLFVRFAIVAVKELLGK